MDAVRHFGRALLDRSRPLDQQQAHAAGVEKGDFLVGLRTEGLAADNLGIELNALFGVADGNAEMGDTFDFGHALSPRSPGKSATYRTYHIGWHLGAYPPHLGIGWPVG